MPVLIVVRRSRIGICVTYSPLSLVRFAKRDDAVTVRF